MHTILLFTAIVALSTGIVNAHLAPFAPGMYCLNGASNTVNLNSADIVTPLWDLPQNEWWFHHTNGCDEYPPADGDFLELPAGGSFTVEIASNRAKTTLAYNGQYTSEWPDGGNYPENYNVPTCITTPNMHTQNQSMAAGTAFAISYTSDLSAVTMENLAVFSVAYNTPWKRVTTYDVPAALPACPEGGCICSWVWIPNGCGEPNIYQTPFRCTVTGATGTAPVAKAQPPVWCEGDSSQCVKGAKQILAWNQASGNNIEVSGYDLEGSHKSPAYNAKCGFPDGAQNDIFESSGSSPSSTTSTKASPTSTPTSTKQSSTSTHPTSTHSTPTSTPTPSPTSTPTHSSTHSFSFSSVPARPSTTAKSCRTGGSKRRRNVAQAHARRRNNNF